MGATAAPHSFLASAPFRLCGPYIERDDGAATAYCYRDGLIVFADQGVHKVLGGFGLVAVGGDNHVPDEYSRRLRRGLRFNGGYEKTRALASTGLRYVFRQGSALRYDADAAQPEVGIFDELRDNLLQLGTGKHETVTAPAAVHGHTHETSPWVEEGRPGEARKGPPVGLDIGIGPSPPGEPRVSADATNHTQAGLNAVAGRQGHGYRHGADAGVPFGEGDRRAFHAQNDDTACHVISQDLPVSLFTTMGVKRDFLTRFGPAGETDDVGVVDLKARPGSAFVVADHIDRWGDLLNEVRKFVGKRNERLFFCFRHVFLHAESYSPFQLPSPPIRVGMGVFNNFLYTPPMIHSIRDNTPSIDTSAFVAWNAEVAGKVQIGANSSVWFSATLRGDMEEIRIGENSNVQDGATVHVDHGLPVQVGDNVTIGHNAVVHACTIGDDCLLGMGAVILSGAKIGEGSVVGAGALVTEGKEFPPRSLLIGSPARAVRNVSDEAIAKIRANADEYRALAADAKNHYREVDA